MEHPDCCSGVIAVWQFGNDKLIGWYYKSSGFDDVVSHAAVRDHFLYGISSVTVSEFHKLANEDNIEENKGW